MRSRGNTSSRSARPAFTLVEILVVSGVIAVLIAILVPALAGGKKTANMAKAMNSLKQISIAMQSYASENREYIVPSQFDYTASAANYAVKIRSDADLAATDRYKGTWSDILWCQLGMGQKVGIDSAQAANPDKYVYDSPDRAFYSADHDFDSPFRSPLPNTHDFAGGNGIPFGLPGGTGATESGLPGYFAANNFFNTDPSAPWAATQPPQWYVTGQIKAPDRSMYLVDSVAGETIDPDPAVNGPWDNPSVDPSATAAAVGLQVDFRYNGACLMLMLDGHSEPQAPWRDLADLKAKSKIKVQNLTQN